MSRHHVRGASPPMQTPPNKLGSPEFQTCLGVPRVGGKLDDYFRALG
jgi:hypothetical protein